MYPRGSLAQVSDRTLMFFLVRVLGQVAKPTSNIRITHNPVGARTPGFYTNALSEKRFFKIGCQCHIGTGIILKDAWHRAGFTGC